MANPTEEFFLFFLTFPSPILPIRFHLGLRWLPTRFVFCGMNMPRQPTRLHCGENMGFYGVISRFLTPALYGQGEPDLISTC